MDKKEFNIFPIGYLKISEGNFLIKIDEKYKYGLKGLSGFSHINIVWWANLFDDKQYRTIVDCKKPYFKGPDEMGIFATRSPIRPNPILITTAYVLSIDNENGVITLPYFDGEDDTPIIDIKPYHPSSDRIKNAFVPDWCNHWPKWYEDSANFNWEKEINI